MITGFNTDIKFEGTTYHVQTEDKGLKTPLILSLVYVGGTIIASKRTPYKDLVEGGFDEKALTERLQRQHKLICAAIKAGRVDDLKKMSGGEAPAAGGTEKEDKVRPEKAGAAHARTAAQRSEAAPQASPESAPKASPRPAQVSAAATEAARAEVGPVPEPPAAAVLTAPPPAETRAAAESADLGDLLALYEGEIAVLEPLQMTLLDEEGDLKAGEQATLRIHVGRGADGQSHAAGAEVTIRVLGTTFRALTLSTRTDSRGLAVVRLLLPRFTSGRAAVIIRATADGESTELRRIIHHF